jgi:hypothetical protein
MRWKFWLDADRVDAMKEWLWIALAIVVITVVIVANL